MNLTGDKELYSLAAEAAVLGSMILDPPVISKVLLKLPDEQAFFMPEHQKIYLALVDMYVKGSEIDPVLLRDELEKRGQLNTIRENETESVKYIGSLMDSVPSSANAVYYSRIVKDRLQYRKLLSTWELISQAVKEPTEIAEKIQQVQALALGLESGNVGQDYV